MPRTTDRLLGILLRDRSSQAVQSPWLGLLAVAVLLGLSASAFGQSGMNTFGTGNGGDIYWAQSNGNNVVGNTSGATSSDPAGFSVDGLWNDTLSTGYNSAPVSPGAFPSINWSTVQSNSPVPATPPGTYPGASPNPSDPGFIPGSTGMTNMPDVVFDAATGNNSPTAVNVNYSPTVYGMYVTNIGTNTEIHTDTSTDPQTITLGNDGITVFNTASQGEAAGMASITIGATKIGSTSYAPLTMNLLGSQTWQNNLGAGGGPSLTSALQVTGPTVVDQSVTSPMTLTLSAPGPLSGIGTGGNTNVGGGAITDNTAGGGTLKLVITSGEWQIGSASTPSSFTGGFSFDPNGTGNCWVKVASPTATGSATATITVPSGDTYSPCTQSGNTGGETFTNPLIISGVGVTAPGGTLGTTYGAIASMESNALTNNSDSSGLNILAGGITLAGSALIEASNCPLNITTNAVNLNGFTLTLSGTASARKILISAPIDDGGQGGGVTINSPNASAGVATTLSGTNNYSGATNVVAGTLTITGTNSGGGAYALSNGTNNAVNFTTTGLVAASTLTLGTSTKATLSGSGTGTLSLTGNVTYAGAAGSSASFNITNGTVTNGNSGSTAISIGNGGGVGTTISGTATIDTTGGDINWFGNIVGSSGLLVVQGANTLSLNSGNNSYSGGTNINGGTVSIGANSAGSVGPLGNPTGAVNLGDGLDATNASLVTGGNFTFNNNITTVAGSMARSPWAATRPIRLHSPARAPESKCSPL